ncbi:cupin domain-containing protein [Acidobacteriota bacterium]
MLKIEKKLQPVVGVFEGVTRHTLACGRDVLMAQFEYKEGSEVPTHKHAYEQVTTVLTGEQKIYIKGMEFTEEFIVRDGESYVVPANFEHSQVSIKKTITIDAWCIAP